jgi:hypothetical protein
VGDTEVSMSRPEAEGVGQCRQEEFTHLGL